MTPYHTTPRNPDAVRLMLGSGGYYVGMGVMQAQEFLLKMAEDFLERVTKPACALARHRKSDTLEVKDVQVGAYGLMFVLSFGDVREGELWAGT